MNTEQEFRVFFGKNIKNRREHKGWSQEELSEKAHVSKNTISDIETGQKFARAKTLINLARVFDTEVYELFKPENIMPDDAEGILIKYNNRVKETLDKTFKEYLKKMR